MAHLPGDLPQGDSAEGTSEPLQGEFVDLVLARKEGLYLGQIDPGVNTIDLKGYFFVCATAAKLELINRSLKSELLINKPPKD